MPAGRTAETGARDVRGVAPWLSEADLRSRAADEKTSTEPRWTARRRRAYNWQLDFIVITPRASARHLAKFLLEIRPGPHLSLFSSQNGHHDEHLAGKGRHRRTNGWPSRSVVCHRRRGAGHMGRWGPRQPGRSRPRRRPRVGNAWRPRRRRALLARATRFRLRGNGGGRCRRTD